MKVVQSLIRVCNLPRLSRRTVFGVSSALKVVIILEMLNYFIFWISLPADSAGKEII